MGTRGQAGYMNQSHVSMTLRRPSLKLAHCLLLIFALLGRPCLANPTDPSTAPQLVIQTGHSGDVPSATISPNGRLIASAGAGALKLWDLATGSELRTWGGNLDAAHAIAFSADGTTVVSGQRNGSIKVWDISTGRQVFELTGHSAEIDAVAVCGSSPLLATGGEDKLVKLWNLSTGRLIRTLKGARATVRSVTFSPDCKTLAAGGEEKAIRIWRVAAGQLLRKLVVHTDGVLSLAFSPNGQTLASGSADESIVLCELLAVDKCRRLLGHRDTVWSIAFSADGRRLVSGSWDHTIKLWDVATGKNEITLDQDRMVTRELRKSRPPRGELGVTAVAFSPDGSLLLSGHDDGLLKLWDVDRAEVQRTLGGAVDKIHSAAFCSEGGILALGNASGNVKLWDLADGSNPRSLEGQSGAIEALACSSNGGTLAAGSSQGSIILWDVASGQIIKRFPQILQPVCSAGFSPDGRTLATGGLDQIILWDAASGRALHILDVSNRDDLCVALAFSPDGNLIASGGPLWKGSKSVILWNVSTGLEIREFDAAQDTTSMVFSPDGKFLATESYGGTVEMWDVVTGGNLFSHRQYVGGATPLNFSPDGATLTSSYALPAAGDDLTAVDTIVQWDAKTGRQLRTLFTQRTGIRTTGASPDGSTIVAVNLDNTTSLRRTSDGQLLATLVSFEDGRWVVTDPEGRFDTADLESMPYLHWVMPDDPLTPLPLEIFMRDYYEPRLLSRTMNGERLKPVRDLHSLNRVQPVVKLVSVAAVPGQPNALDVSVEATGASRRYQPDLPAVETSAHDLRIFRNGQLVGYTNGLLDGTEKEPYHKTFRVRVPAGNAVIRFSVYAFNDDRVKSNTAELDYTPPVAVLTATSRAYVITVGVNHHDNAAWDLHYAVNDAQAMSKSVIKRLGDQNIYQDIVPIVLVSDAENQLATKSNIRAALDRLAGRAANVASIPNGERLQRATPDDFVLISFSGHGFDADGEFYLIPEDTGAGQDRTVTRELVAHAISSNELADWLRDVDGGDMAMSIDACQSAASVGAEFKPGPMGASGLGQLAYEKGMRILAASQAEESARESKLTQHGLLTYALVHDGLDRGQADYKPLDGKITLGEWFAYGVQRVPALANEVALEKLDAWGGADTAKGSQSLMADHDQRSALQQPALFDFTKGRRDAVIAIAVGSP